MAKVIAQNSDFILYSNGTFTSKQVSTIDVAHKVIKAWREHLNQKEEEDYLVNTFTHSKVYYGE